MSSRRWRWATGMVVVLLLLGLLAFVLGPRERRARVASALGVGVGAGEATGDRHAGIASWKRTRPQNGFEGVVVDAIGEKPIAGASITIASWTTEILATVTGPDGRFHLDELPEGADMVTANAVGFATTTKRLWDGEREREVRIVLDGAVLLAGRVIDENGVPVAGIDVWADDSLRTQSQEMKPVSTFVKTGRDGRFEIPDAPPGDIVVHAGPPGAALATLEVGVLAWGRERKDLELVVTDGVPISGIVQTRNKAPVAGARVYFNRYSLERGGWLKVSTLSEAGGVFHLHGAVPGNAGLAAVADNGDVGSVDIDVGPAGKTGVVVTIDNPTTVSGIVVDESGSPFGGVRLYTRTYGSDGMLALHFGVEEESGRDPSAMTTDASGRFTLSADETRPEVKIHAESPAGAAASATCAPGTTGLRIVVPRRLDAGLCSVEIRILDHAGKRFRGSVWLEGERESEPGESKEAAYFPTGMYRGGVIPRAITCGTWKLATRPEGVANSRSDEVRVTLVPGEIAHVELRLPDQTNGQGWVTGRLVDDGGGPVAGAYVAQELTYIPTMGGDIRMSCDVAYFNNWDESVRSGLDGRFRVQAMSGQRRIMAVRPEYVTRVVAVEVPVGNTSDGGTVVMTRGPSAESVRTGLPGCATPTPVPAVTGSSHDHDGGW